MTIHSIRRNLKCSKKNAKFIFKNTSNLKLLFKDPEEVTIRWTIEDILNQDKRSIEFRGNNQKPLSKDEAFEVLDLLERKHDCNIGITWEVIDIWIDYIREG